MQTKAFPVNTRTRNGYTCTVHKRRDEPDSMKVIATQNTGLALTST